MPPLLLLLLLPLTLHGECTLKLTSCCGSALM
jgi:hypothetical protein